MPRHVQALLLVPLLVGCADVRLFGSYPGQTIRTAAESRLVISRPVEERDSGRIDRAIEGGYEPNDRIVCAEPSPDAITAVGRSAALQGRIPVSVGSPATSATAEAALAYAMAQQTAYVGYRTATIQAVRDLAFQSCLAYSNGILTRPDFRRVLAQTDNILIGMHAIDGLTAAIPAPPVIVGASGTVTAQPGQPAAATATPANITVVNAGGQSQPSLATPPKDEVGARAPATRTTSADEARLAHLAVVADAIVRIVCHTVLNRETEHTVLVRDPVTNEMVRALNVPTWGCPPYDRPANPSSPIRVAAPASSPQGR
ncbi:hypothetical protein ACFQX4_23695 [Roseomonas sp. GCM10028921]